MASWSRAALLKWGAFGLLALAALVIRVPRFDAPPLEFFSTRELNSALMARHWYFVTSADIPSWRRDVDAANRKPFLEPPVMELSSVALYHLNGGERLAFPRALATGFWLVAGLFLFALLDELFPRAAALAGTAYFLFARFGVIASTTFMPDSLMMMFFAAALWALLRFDVQPSRRSLLRAAALAGAAGVIKPFPLFFLVGSAAALALRRRGARDAPSNLQYLLYVILAMTPAVAYSLNPRFPLAWKVRSSILPQLLLTPEYWAGWGALAVEVAGIVGLILGGIALVTSAGRTRALLAGLLAGYAAFGLSFSYHIHTHSYYSLPLLILVSVALARVTAAAMRRGTRARFPGAAAAAGPVLVGLALVSAAAAMDESALDLRSRRVDDARRIGEVVGHSPRVVSLTTDYGNLLSYYGEVGAKGWWPNVYDLRADDLAGTRSPPVEERFATLEREYAPEFFVATWMDEFRRQQDLVAFLRARFPVLEESEDYIVFDLRAPAR